MAMVCATVAQVTYGQQMAPDAGDMLVHVVGGAVTYDGSKRMFADRAVMKRNYPEAEVHTVSQHELLVALGADKADVKDSLGIAETDSANTNEQDRVVVADDAGEPVASPVDVQPYDPIDPLASKYGEMISVDPQDINNYPLYRFIDEWYGVRYKYGGEDVTGIDCSAFSQKLYGKVYNKDIMRTARLQRKNSERIRHAYDAEEGDLVFFRIHRTRISHVGVYLANGYFVHASRSHGVMISSLDSKYWHRRFAGCGRIEHEEKTNLESDSPQ